MFTFRETEGLPGMTWCLRFIPETFSSWKDDFTIYMWEGKNRISYAKAKTDEQKYIQAAYEDIEMGEPEDRVDEEEEAEEDEESNDESGEELEDDEGAESSDSEAFGNGAKNEQLAVGYKSDLSFVGRGSMIGVFAHKDDKIRFRTAIERVRDTNGKAFSPSKVRIVGQAGINDR